MPGFFDKLRDGAGKAAFEADRMRRASQAQSRLKALQRQQKDQIRALGQQAWELYGAGALSQPSLLAICEQIEALRQQIADQEAKVEQIRQEKMPEVAPARPDLAWQGPVCPQCQMPIAPDSGFCHQCGSQVGGAAPPPPASAQRCQRCGADVAPEALFCPECGAPVKGGAGLKEAEAPVARTCPSCQTEIPIEAGFCPECGAPVNEGGRPVAPVPFVHDGQPATHEPSEPVFFPGAAERRGPVERAEPLAPIERVEPLTPVEQVEPPGPVERAEPLALIERVESLTPVEQVEPPGPVEKAEPPVPMERVEPLAPIEQIDPVIPMERAESPAPFEPPDPAAPPPVDAETGWVECRHCQTLIPEEAIFCPECGGSAAPVQDSPSEGESPAPGRHEMPSEPTTEDPTAALVGSPSPSEPGVVAPWIGREGPPATEERLAAGMLCSVCGTEVPLEAGFCPECGTPVAPATEHFG